MGQVSSLVNLPRYVKNGLNDLFLERTPFGPNSAAQFRGNDELQNLVFSAENEIWQVYQTNPRMIIGRKGSGKTSVLSRTSELDEFKIVHKVSTSELIRQVTDQLYSSPTDQRRIPAEISAKYWKRAISVSLMGEVISCFPERDFGKIEKYFLKLGKKGENGINNAILKLKRNADSVDNGSYISYFVSLGLGFLSDFDIDFDEALRELDHYLTERNIKVAVLVDSIEEYHVEEIQTESVLKGLLRCVGSYGTRHRQVRMSIPAEVYFDLREISSNIMKDFHDSMVLHWSPIELLRMVAWRYLIFLALNDEHRLHKFSNVDLSKRADVHSVIGDFLPIEIANRGSQPEYSIAYLLRHTQLLPRQLITLLNSAFSRVRPNSPREEFSSSNDLVLAISDVEDTICDEVFGAYRFKYPFAEKLCGEVIPNLPRFFYEKDLEIQFRDVGKLIMQQHSHLISPDFTEFKRVLIEIGAIGRVTEKTAVYADAEFEYAVPGKLSISKKDELCLHPVFSGAYETNVNRSSDHYVYPHMKLYNEEFDRKLRMTHT